ncbi:MAG: hypothetical protein ONB44_04740 [candidate division KSB1 bacterium]|nr:hypothetical protein [candidate division KSB1 bacterium]MDZ7301430.1 hypothetical protein [candidate division KSB1 bacterium]MDZ7313462.1 hypothetical protein [candidate division KSB1 bacterium]
MRAEEIICLAILPLDVEAGMYYALRSLHYTFDRMGYKDDLARRLAKIALGKTCEATLIRFLRQHAIPHLSKEGETPHTDPDRFDLRILNEVVDLKTFGVPDQVAQPERLLNCLALVPCHHRNDQWSKRKNYERFLFGFCKGTMKIRLKKKEPPAKFTLEDFELGSVPTILYLAAAPTIAECEKLFHLVQRGTVCPQYPGGTRIDNMGCRIGDLSSFQNFLTKLEKFQRR